MRTILRTVQPNQSDQTWLCPAGCSDVPYHWSQNPLEKLEAYGVRENCLEWFKSQLVDRYRTVELYEQKVKTIIFKTLWKTFPYGCPEADFNVEKRYL